MPVSETSRRHGWVFGGAAAGAAVLLLAVIAVVGALWSRSNDATTVGDERGAGAGTITLTDAEANTSASCLAPTPASMRERNDLAFAGTVTDVSPTSARFAVERWYTGGGSAATVLLTRAGQMPGLLYTPDLAAGQRYLIVATDGRIGYCDPSGTWSVGAGEDVRRRFRARHSRR